MSSHAQQARTLVEALPYIQKFTGKTIVVKYGGNAMVSDELRRAVMCDIILLSLVGIRVVVVHGGGPEISEMLKKLGHESRFVDGLRYTDAETMDVVQSVLCGKVNKNLVAQLNRLGGQAIGLCGMDGQLFQAEQLDEKYGLVGKITGVNPEPVENALLSGGSFVIPELMAGGTNTIATLSVPYLMEEDFNNITGYSDHDNAEYGTTIDGTTTASDLSQYGLIGWTGARTGVQEKGEGNEGSIRVCCRSQNAFGVSRYHGRLDSAPLNGIKPDKTPTVKISFNYGGGRGGNDSYSPIAAYGYTTTQGKIDSKSDSKQNWYISGATVFDDLPLDSNFNSIPKEKTYTIENCTNLHRLSWEVNSTGSAWAANANSWLYLDNIKVSIANE